MRVNPEHGVVVRVVLWCLLVAPLQAGESETPNWTRIRGGHANGVGADMQNEESTSQLRWNNGDGLPGRLLESKSGQIRWFSPIFADELVVDTEALAAIVFPGQNVQGTEIFRVGTTSGDVFTADLVGSDGNTFLFSSRRYGEVRVGRDAVYSLQRRVHANLVFDGSQLKDWDLAPDAPIKDLSYKVYREDRGWNGGEFPDLSRLNPVDEGRLAAGYLDLGLADAEGRFGMVFEGRLEIAEEGKYRFDVWADDKARLFIDGKSIVEFLEMGRNPEAGGHSTFVQLATGFHSLRVEYLELGGSFRLVAGVTGPDSGRRSLVGTNQGSGWKRGLGGHPQTDRKKTGIFREIEVPKRFEMDLELASSGSPRFVLALGKDKLSAESMQSLRLETWGDELVVVQDKVFEPVMTIEEDVSEIRLRLALDSEAGEVRMFDANGRSLVAVNGIKTTTGGSGIYIRNRGEDLTVRRLSVYRQSNKLAGQPVDSSKARVHLIDGRVLCGQLLVGNGGAFVVDQDGMQQDVDVTTVDRIARPRVHLAASSAPVELTYADGAILRGRVEEANSDQVILRTSFSETPVTCALAGASMLRFAPSASGAKPPSLDSDQLFSPSGRLRGQLAFDVAGSPLGWKPEGAATSLRLTALGRARVERNSKRISYRASFEIDQFPHILHLKTGEILPCKVVSYSRETLGLQAPFMSGREIASTYVKGIELSPVRRSQPREQQTETERWLDEPLGADPATSAVDDIKLLRALTVPRFNRDSPPSHILVAKTGDLKRGTLLSINGPTIQFVSKLREMHVPTDRISCIVNVSGPEHFEEDDSAQVEVAPDTAATSQSLQNRSVRATLADGSVLIFEPRESKDDTLSGHSSVYGKTTIPIESILNLTFGESESENVGSLFAEWVVRTAKEPQFGE